MLDTAGKILHRARREKGISLEQAARATKMRAARIVDLENDNYAQFPNIAYAKGFLLLYGKYLGVDVSAYANSFQNSTRVSVDEYEYLNHPRVRSAPARGAQAVKSLAPLVVIGLFLLIAAAGTFLFISFKRLPDLDATSAAGPGSSNRLSRETTEPMSAAASLPIPESGLAPNAAPEVLAPISDSKAGAASPNAEGVRPVPEPSTASSEAVESAPEEPTRIATSNAQPTGDDRSWIANATRAPAAAPIHEVSLQPLKKTWVRIQKDDPDSPPLFEDWLYPDARPLTFRGTRFWIKAGEKDALQIRKDGQPIRYEGSSITIE